MLTDDDVRDIVRMLDSTQLDELHVQTGEVSVTIRRGAAGTGWTAETRVDRPPNVQPADVRPQDQAQPDDSDTARRASNAPEEDGLHRVTAPLPGTFYRAPQPGAPPFVEVGSEVTPGTLVGIVETMKMMNSVYAGTSGVVRQICVDNAGSATAGGTLMLVEESG